MAVGAVHLACFSFDRLYFGQMVFMNLFIFSSMKILPLKLASWLRHPHIYCYEFGFLLYSIYRSHEDSFILEVQM